MVGDIAPSTGRYNCRLTPPVTGDGHRDYRTAPPRLSRRPVDGLVRRHRFGIPEAESISSSFDDSSFHSHCVLQASETQTFHSPAVNSSL